MRRIKLKSAFEKFRPNSRKKKIILILISIALIGFGFAGFLFLKKDPPKQEVATLPDCYVIFAQVANLVAPGSADQAYELLESNEQRCASQQETDRTKQFTYYAVFAWVAYNKDGVDRSVAFEHANKAEGLLNTLTPAELDSVQDRWRITNNLRIVLNSMPIKQQGAN